MKNLLLIAAGVALCLLCTVVGILIPQLSALTYVTVSLALRLLPSLLDPS